MPDFMCPVCLRPVPSPIKEGTPCSVHPTRLLLPKAYVKAHSDDPYLGLILSDKYELHKSLGHGGFGSVYYAIQRGQIRQAVAVKLLTRLKTAERLLALGGRWTEGCFACVSLFSVWMKCGLLPIHRPLLRKLLFCPLLTRLLFS